MRRREFITLLGGAAAWPLAARAQQGERMRRIGVLSTFAESDPETQSMVGARASRRLIVLISPSASRRRSARWCRCRAQHRRGAVHRAAYARRGRA